MLDGPGELTVLQGSDQHIIWVPQRSGLKHTVFTIPAQLQNRKKKSALQLKVEAWSPFSNTAYAVAWSGNKASVYAWDQDMLSRRIIDLGFDPNKCDVVPEAFLKEPHTDGIRIINCIEGIEAQLWNNGFLESTRWWPATPPKFEWSLFARSTGEPASSGIPLAQNPNWMDFPWHRVQLSGDILTQVLRNERIVVTGCAILLAPCLFLASEWLTYSAMTAQLSTSIATIEAESRPVRLDRAKALTALDAAEDLFSLTRYPPQIEILSRAHNLLRPYPVTLSTWDYDEGILEFGILSDADTDARIFISAFEADPLFSSVRASTVGQSLVMSMTVVSESGE